MNKKQIILIGAGGHCKSCIDVLESENKFEIIGILDLPNRFGQDILGYKIIGNDNDIPQLAKDGQNFLLTVGHLGDSKKRIKLFNLVKSNGGNLPVIISPTSYVSIHSEIGEGTIIMHHVLVNANAVIQKNCIINSKSIIEHDAVIGNHCHISTASVVNGGVKIGDNVFFGSGAVSKQGIEIPENSFIRANSIVK
jgi:sugar O-acyltransferase (sialic acid O-acetyltransferase NeuD family)|tara:strand:- start:8920 stop:9504 length:585 start_codon:yes stop_codon:yes gene_type:complete